MGIFFATEIIDLKSSAAKMKDDFRQAGKYFKYFLITSLYKFWLRNLK